jgi:enoyl-CoA hydratase/carnithine racemase
VDAAELDNSVDQLAAGILAAPPIAAREVKRLVDLAGRTDLSHGMDEESLSQQKMFASHDFSEAIAAFLEKRKADYANR